MKKISILLMFSLILISCSSIPEVDGAKTESASTNPQNIDVIEVTEVIKTEPASTNSQNIDVTEVTEGTIEVIELSHYPEDFLTMKSAKDINKDIHDAPYSEPFVYATGENANGDFRIAYYDDFHTFESRDYYSDSEEDPIRWGIDQTVYINQNSVTSEIGSKCVGVFAQPIQRGRCYP